MADHILTPSIAPVLSNRRLTINLQQDGRGIVEVQSCEVAGADFLNRTSFRDAKQLEDVFIKRLAQALTELVETLPKGAHMLSKPEFLLELPGALLAGVRLLVSEPREGARRMIVRFKEFLGGINSLMKADIGGARERAVSHADNLAVNALMDICIPIMNFCRSDELARLEGGGHASRVVEDKLREFEFHTELLKRYLANQRTVAEEDTETATIEPPTHLHAISAGRVANG